MHVIPNEKVEETIPKLAALDYEGLEFWEQYLSTADLKRLRKILIENDMKVAQLCPYFEFTLDEERWRWSVKMAEVYIQRCLELECSLIRTYTNCPWERRLPFPPTGKPLLRSADATDAQWKAAIRGLKKICKMGSKYDINFALENSPGLLDSSESVLNLIEEVGAENLGVNLQVPLSTDKEKGMNYMESVEKLGEHVIHVHANNYTEDGTFTFLDEGYIDYEAIIRRLHEKFGFNGYVSVEHATHGGRHTPLETAEHEIVYLKNLIKKITS